MYLPVRPTGPHTGPMKTYDTVVVGGRGAVGSLFAAMIAADGRSVTTIDPAAIDETKQAGSAPGVTHLTGDILEPDDAVRAVLQHCSTVVLAVPESVAERVSFSHFTSAQLLVDTLSVKSGFAAKVDADAPPFEVLGVNPMFAPSLGMDGRPVATVAYRRGPGVDGFLARITAWGGNVVEVDADTHDRLAAATQALTHASVLAYGSAVAALDLDPALLDAVAPPPARTSLALLARISGGEPEVYWDVQAGNPYAADARAALAQAVDTLDAVVASGSQAAFAHLMRQAATSVPDEDAYRALCGRLFGIVRGQGPEGGRP